MTTYKFTFCKLLKFWPILIQTVFAINHVAVLELLPNESVQGKISIEESRHLTDELRRQAVMNLPKGDYTVMTRDNIIALIPADEKEAECLAESCAVTIGRAIGVEFITQGTIGKFGNKLTISVELYETMNAKLLSSIVFESKDIDGLLGAIRKEAKPLFQSIITSKPLSEPGFAGLPEQARTPNNNASPNAGYTYFKDYQDDKSSKSLNQVNQGSDNKSMRLSQWLGIGFAVAGIGAGVYGILQESESKNLYEKYNNAKTTEDAISKRKDIESAEKQRNIGYIIGGALLASGITVWFVF